MEVYTTNKNAKVIELYDDLEDYVLKKDRKIIRNYLVKGISFNYRCRVLEVTLNEQEMILYFLKDIKIFDKENRLSIRKKLIKLTHLWIVIIIYYLVQNQRFVV